MNAARSSSRGVLAGAAVVVALVAAGCGSDPHTTYFIHGSGTLQVSGGPRLVEAVLTPGSVPYGAATLAPRAPRRLGFDFLASGGVLEFALGDFTGVGTYSDVRDLAFSLDGVTYGCDSFSPCTGCAVTISQASDAVISGDIACASMSGCPSDLARRDPGDPACRGTAAPAINIEGTFRVDEPKSKPLDY